MRVADSAIMRFLRLLVFCLILNLGLSSQKDENIKKIAIDKIKQIFFDLITRTRCVMIPKTVISNEPNDNKVVKILEKYKEYLEHMKHAADQDLKTIYHILKLIKCEYYKQEANEKTDLQACINYMRGYLDESYSYGSGQKKHGRSISNMDTRKYSIPRNCNQLPIVLQACIDYNKRYSCLTGNQLYDLRSMCDGRDDCDDGSDELQCAERVSELLQNTIKISHDLKEAFKVENCFENLEALFNRPLDIMTNIKIYSNVHEKVEALDQAKNLLNETFCTSEKPFPIVYEKVNKKSTCICQSGECKGLCKSICSGICEQRQLLAEFECPDGAGRTVPMASLCDGRPDCDDHSDEIDCSGNETNRKFLAYGLLRKLSEDLNRLMTSKGNSYVFPHLLNLQKNFIELEQNVTSKFARESANVKIFESLENVLPTAIDTNEISLNEIKHLYNLLKIFKNDLTLLFKSIGRAQKEASAEGDEKCQCLGQQCMAEECGVPCERTCAALAAVLTYACHGHQKRIRLAAVCDRTSQCPYGDDETQCATDKCQRHHLTTILHDLKISDKYDGVFGETLNKWILKSSERIENASQELTMPSRLDILKLIEGILNDLRTVYYKYFSSTVSVATKPGKQDSPQVKLLTNIVTRLGNRTKICQ